MEPLNAFRYANRVYRGTGEIADLCAWTDGQQVVSGWRMNWRERLFALLFGHVWITLLCGERVPPIAAQVRRRLLYEADEGDWRAARLRHADYIEKRRREADYRSVERRFRHWRWRLWYWLIG